MKKVIFASFLLCFSIFLTPITGWSQQVTGLAVHGPYNGQTILTWNEVNPPAIPASTTSVATVDTYVTNLATANPSYTYNIYHSASQINAVASLTPVATGVRQLTGWNDDNSLPNQAGVPLRFVVDEGGTGNLVPQTPVANGTGVYAYNPATAGPGYYAITVSVNGVENTTITLGQNSLTNPVTETVGRGDPILQCTATEINNPNNFIAQDTTYYYVRWEYPDNCSLFSTPMNYALRVPLGTTFPAPLGINLHCWGANLDNPCYFPPNAGAAGSTPPHLSMLVSSDECPYDWWTGYYDKAWTGMNGGGGETFLPGGSSSWATSGVVKDYSEQRMVSIYDWIAANWDNGSKVDLTRGFIAGVSMGGSGTAMLMIRYPGRFAWCYSSVGVHIPLLSPVFEGSYAGVYGDPTWNVLYQSLTIVPTIRAFDYFDDTQYLASHPTLQTGYMCVANGKNDSGIGWNQAWQYVKAMQAAKMPFIFYWTQNGHQTRACGPYPSAGNNMAIDVQNNQSIPAFENCSIDDAIGDGVEDGTGAGLNGGTHGYATGAINGYLYWNPATIVDTAGSWQMDIGLVSAAHGLTWAASCTVDITPRRLQSFAVSPGQCFNWTNTDLNTSTVIQSGSATADTNGFITLPAVLIKNQLQWQNRINIVPSGTCATKTNTPTETNTPTAGPSQTSTATPTITLTATQTATASITGTPTPTYTAGPSQTGTATGTSTYTATATSACVQFQVACKSSEVPSGNTNGQPVNPAVGPHGTVKISGAGSITFDPFEPGGSPTDGFFCGVGGVTNQSGYWNWSGAQIGTIFSPTGGDVIFYWKSYASMAQRNTDNKTGWSFGVTDDGTRTLWRIEVSPAGGAYNTITWQANSPSSGQYFDTTYTVNAGEIAKFRLSWTATTQSLYINDILIQSGATTAYTPSWGASSQFNIGASAGDNGFSGWKASKDTIADLQVNATCAGNTNTPTVTATLTGTASPTASPTLTYTTGPSQTATNTMTTSYTGTTTYTATVTASPSSTSTRTFTGTVTVTPSLTLTPSSTNTITQTPTSSTTATVTQTSTQTLSPSQTFTASATPTRTDTATQTMTSSQTLTSSQTYTITQTFTSTATPSQTYTFTQTATFTQTSTPSQTLTPSYTSTPSNTVTPSLTLTSSMTFTNSPTFTPTASAPLWIASHVPYPNPVRDNNGTKLYIKMTDVPNRISVRIYTTSMRLIWDISVENPALQIEYNNEVAYFTYTLPYSLTDNHNVPLANGLYYYSITANNMTSSTNSRQARVMGKLAVLK